jgi:hypothetical protein
MNLIRPVRPLACRVRPLRYAYPGASGSGTPIYSSAAIKYGTEDRSLTIPKTVFFKKSILVVINIERILKLIANILFNINM